MIRRPIVFLWLMPIIWSPVVSALLGRHHPYRHHAWGNLPQMRIYDMKVLSESSSASASRLAEGFEAKSEENDIEQAVAAAYDEFLGDIGTPEDSEKEDYDPEPVFPSPTASVSNSSSSTFQYAALEPGTVVKIQVGDITLARKAWKKRRRSGSPLLVPCSVLNADRLSTIRWNLIYLLEKFGSGSNKNNGIRLSFSSLNQRYRSHLKGSLQRHASLLGFDTTEDLILHLFKTRVQETYGVKVVEQDSSDGQGTQHWLESPVSRFRAQKRANQAAVLQFQDDAQSDTLPHTGFVRNKNPNPTENGNFYQLRPLSAALRVSQKEDVESGHITNGSLHPAVVFDYDPTGDAGAPLLTLSLNPSRNRVRERLKLLNSPLQRQTIDNPKYNLKELHMGDGPLTGKVVRFTKGGALVDCRVGRNSNTKTGDGPKSKHEMVQVLGFLRFSDTVTTSADIDDEEWDGSLSKKDDKGNSQKGTEQDFDFNGFRKETEMEEEADFAESEDITHLYQLADDGSLIYKDEDTGDHSIIYSTDDNDDDDALEEETTFQSKSSSDLEWDDSTDFPVIFKRKSRPWVLRSNMKLGGKSRQFKLGDQVEVYVKSVSKQSGQLQLTMSSKDQGKKPVEVKRETDCEKKLARLEKQLGGLHVIEELKGLELNGVVKAMSKTGDWLYVQPLSDHNLPVGVATCSGDHQLNLKQGDSVVVSLDGIDTSRGQLAMRILDKIST